MKITDKNRNPNPIKHPLYVGTSMVVAIDAVHVQRLGIDEDTFFEEKPVENGILLEMRKLSVQEENRNEIKTKT